MLAAELQVGYTFELKGLRRVSEIDLDVEWPQRICDFFSLNHVCVSHFK